MTRCVRLLCVLALVLVCLGAPRAAADSSASRIEMYCTVNADGDCLVSMTVLLHLESSADSLTFPLPATAEKITMNGSSSISTTRTKEATTVYVSKATGGMLGDFTIRFDYILPGAVGVTPERKLQLTLPMLSGFIYPVQNFSFIITLPEDVPTQPIFSSTYQSIGFESSLNLVVSSNMITGSSISALNDHETVTMTLSVPQAMFPTISTYQRTGNPELIPMGVLAGLALLYWLIFLRNLPPMRTRTTVPPEGISAGEMACRVTLSGGDLTMLVLSWAQMGYLQLQTDGRRVLLVKQMDMDSERSLFEIRIFQELFGRRRVVDCSSAAYAKLFRKTAAMVPGEKKMCRSAPYARLVYRVLLCAAQVFCGICVAMNITSIYGLQIVYSIIFGILSAISAWEIQKFAFYTRNRFRWHTWVSLAICAAWVLLGLIAGQALIPLGAVTAQLLLGYLAAYGGRRTDLNRSEAGEILALRRFLKTIPRPEAARHLKLDPEYFFRMAPYAIALGVEKPFAAAFGRRKVEQCPYLVTRIRGSRTAEEWMRLLTQTVRLMDERHTRTSIETFLAVRFQSNTPGR